MDSVEPTLTDPKIAAPRNLRQTFELFAALDEDDAIETLLSKVDWSGMTPRQAYLAVLGRLPESAALAMVPQNYVPQEQFRQALASGEFQVLIRENILRSFPEKKRLIFIHIPKCAGTDLVDALAVRYPRVGEHLAFPQWFSGKVLHSYLRDMALQLATSDSILVHGHIPLPWFLERGFTCLDDSYFTVVRHPVDIMISQVNYVLKRFYETPRFRQPDSREWADFLGLSSFNRDMPRAELIDLGLRILRDPRIVAPNCICTYLGYGTEASAADLIARFDMEITDIRRYDRWLKERWGATTARANTSTSIIDRDSLSPEDRAYAESICKEDMALYRRIMACLDASSGPSIRGSQLFETAGGNLTSA
jgi:hypothetical protein